MKKFVLSIKNIMFMSVIFILLVVMAGCGAQKGATQNSESKTSNSALSDKSSEDKGASVNPTGATTAPAVEKVATQGAVDSTKKSTGSKVAASAVKSRKLLSISGNGVENSVKISLADVKGMQQGAFAGDFFALNSYGTKAYFSFKGVTLPYILDHVVKLKKNASKVTFLADDGYSYSCTLAEAKKTDYMDEQNPDQHYPVIIAWEENGKAYDPTEGSPFRVVFGQKAPGDVNKPNWVLHVKSVIID